MKKIIYLLVGVVLWAGLWTGCITELGKVKEEFRIITDETGKKLEVLECATAVCCFKLVNAGNTEGEWRIEAPTDWLAAFSPASGSLAAGDTEIIVFRRKLQEEDKETEILVRTEKEDLPLKIVSKGFCMEMVYVEGGQFVMGATAEQEEDAFDNEYPVRTVSLDSYHIGKYEVTQGQWKAVMGTEPACFTGDNLPVEDVSWIEAQAFCRKLSEATGKKYGLPTEAQWEYAARGGNKSQGYKYAGSDDIDEVAWHYGNSLVKTHPVGEKKANELGIYDMSGNVWEWCSDWYGAYDKSDTVNPQDVASGAYRVVRGGGFFNAAYYCRVAYRSYDVPVFGNCYHGFRVAIDSK